jgi:CheY-like chemotaxis protein
MPADMPHTVNIVARQTLRSVSLTLSDGSGSAEARAKARDAAMARHWGMSLARTLLQRSGGDLSGYSAIGFGTLITIRLPAAPTSATPQNRSDGEVRTMARRPLQSPDRVSEDPKALPTAASVEKMSVLIVDDNTALTGALAMRLAMDGGFECLPAMHELCSAVEQITAQQPAIVLLDLNLPGTEGPLDVIRGLRTSAPDTRVIVLTGNPSDEAVRGARDAGAVGFVAKGVGAERLLNVMSRATPENFMLELDG